MKTEIDLVDYGGGNIGSVQRALERLDVSYARVSDKNQLSGNRPVIMPGVGSFGAVMKSLRKAGLDSRLVDIADGGTPYLGICVGMQVLFESSEESPAEKGLGVLRGSVIRFREGKVPQIGWNEIRAKSSDEPAGYVYFVNSYFAVPNDDDCVLYESSYYSPFCAAVKSKNVTAFQFHPEKSGKFGIDLLARWIANAS